MSRANSDLDNPDQFERSMEGIDSTSEGLYERMYRAEHKRREHLYGLLSFHSGVIVLELAAASYFLKCLRAIGYAHWLIPMYSLLAVGFVFIVVAIVHLAISFLRDAYAYLPTPQEIETYRSELLDYFDDSPGKDQFVDSRLRSLIRNWLVESTHYNFAVNNRRSAMRYRASVAWIVALGLLAFNVPLLVVG